MPLLRIQRYKSTSVVVDTTQQKTVQGPLVFPGLARFTLDPSVAWTAGVYSLLAYDTFDYAGSGSGYASGQACLDALVDVVTTGTGRTATALTDDPANSRILVTLV
jgi:hypothetical protein